MYDVYFFEAFAEEAEHIKKHMPSGIKAGFTRETIQESNFASAKTPPASLISIRTQSRIPQIWEPHIKGVLSRSTGYDHLLQYLETFACGYLPLYCVRAVAEQAMLLWTALLRKLPRQVAQLRTFDRDGITGHEVKGKNLLVVGVGRIGYETYKIGEALGMKCLGVDGVKAYPDVRYADIETAIRTANVIVCAMSLTPASRNYFTYELFKKAPRGVIFINVSRGECAPTAILLKLLKEAHLGGVGLDVYEDEYLIAPAFRKRKTDTARAEKSPSLTALKSLLAHENVICTPHNGFNTFEAVERKSADSVRQALHFLKYGKFLWEVPTALQNPYKLIKRMLR